MFSNVLNNQKIPKMIQTVVKQENNSSSTDNDDVIIRQTISMIFSREELSVFKQN